MRKWLAGFALMILLLLPVGVNAQGVTGFDTVDVSVWPEYDTPTALVIYKISLGSQVILPADISLRLPGSVDKVAAVAVGNSADTVTDSGVNYKFTPGTDFARVTITATGRFIHVEYYDPALVKNGNQHQYLFEWPGETSVENFHFELRQPLQSSNLVVQPALGNTVMDADGFQFSDFTQSGVKAGQKLAFDIKYERDTDSPSTSFLNVQSSAPLDQTIPGQSNWTSYLPWGLGGLGLALLLIALWTYVTSGRTNRATSAVRKRHTNRAAVEPDGSDQQVHCSQCGKRAQPGDRFCRACGTKIRRGDE